MHWKSLNHIVQPIILGSGSPRRRDLFKYIFKQFEVITTNAELDQHTGDAADFVLRNARYKANQILIENTEAVSNGTLFTFDTVVALENRILGKPKNIDAARDMLKDLCGKTHQVLTAYCVINLSNSEEIIVDYATTNVKFINYDSSHLEAYLNTGESLDKAGSYGIQGFGRLLVDSIEGCYFNVVGMPVTAVFKDLGGVPK
tara:strand:+ start:709 stop:1314 length:606 start_codon:yes stop_codon:yes gene_type:complete